MIRKIEIKVFGPEHIFEALDLLSDAFLRQKEPTAYHLNNKNEDAFRYQTLCYMNETYDYHLLLLILIIIIKLRCIFEC